MNSKDFDPQVGGYRLPDAPDVKFNFKCFFSKHHDLEPLSASTIGVERMPSAPAPTPRPGYVFVEDLISVRGFSSIREVVVRCRRCRRRWLTREPEGYLTYTISRWQVWQVGNRKVIPPLEGPER